MLLENPGLYDELKSKVKLTPFAGKLVLSRRKEFCLFLHFFSHKSCKNRNEYFKTAFGPTYIGFRITSFGFRVELQNIPLRVLGLGSGYFWVPPPPVQLNTFCTVGLKPIFLRRIVRKDLDSLESHSRIKWTLNILQYRKWIKKLDSLR